MPYTRDDCLFCNGVSFGTASIAGAYTGVFPVYLLRVLVPGLGFDQVLRVLGVSGAAALLALLIVATTAAPAAAAIAFVQNLGTRTGNGTSVAMTTRFAEGPASDRERLAHCYAMDAVASLQGPPSMTGVFAAPPSTQSSVSKRPL